MPVRPRARSHAQLYPVAICRGTSERDAWDVAGSARIASQPIPDRQPHSRTTSPRDHAAAPHLADGAAEPPETIAVEVSTSPDSRPIASRRPICSCCPIRQLARRIFSLARGMLSRKVCIGVLP